MNSKLSIFALILGLVASPFQLAHALNVTSSYSASTNAITFDPWIRSGTSLEEINRSIVTPQSTVETVGDITRREQQSDGSWLGFYNVHVVSGMTVDYTMGYKDYYTFSLGAITPSNYGTNTVNINLNATTADFTGFQISLYGYVGGVNATAKPSILVNNTNVVNSGYFDYTSYWSYASWDYYDFRSNSNLNIQINNPQNGTFHSAWITSVTNYYNIYHDIRWLGSEYDVVRSMTVAAPVTSVPEPETYAMFLIGLGLIVGFARRRKQK